MSQAADLPLADSHGRAADRPGSRPDSVLPTVMGLGLMWLVLMMVFGAHYYSDIFLRLHSPQERLFRASPQTISSMDLRVRLMWPISMHAPGDRSAQALSNIAQLIGLELAPGVHERVDASRVGFRFTEIPVYEALHRVLANPRIGFIAQGRTLDLIDQQLQVDRRRGRLQDMNWRARMALGADRLVIVPTHEADLWFSLRLTGEADEPERLWRGIQAEIWQHGQWMAMAQSMLNERGAARIALTTAEECILTLQRIQGEDPDAAQVFDIQLFYQNGPGSS